MKSNAKINPIFKNPYNHHYFWVNKVINNENLWEGHFENQNITYDSKIIYTGILDNEKNVFHYGFAVYPNSYTLLGFLKHVFLPTACLTWFDRKCDNFYIPLESYENVVEEINKFNDDIDSYAVHCMNNSYNSLKDLSLLDNKSLYSKIETFCEDFNKNWNNDYDRKLFIKVFDSPSDVFNFIKNSIGWSDCNEFIEEEISMSLDKLEFTCTKAITEPLLNRKLIDILNINIPVLF